jgi:hypothetical protein
MIKNDYDLFWSKTRAPLKPSHVQSIVATAVNEYRTTRDAKGSMEHGCDIVENAQFGVIYQNPGDGDGYERLLDTIKQLGYDEKVFFTGRNIRIGGGTFTITHQCNRDNVRNEIYVIGQDFTKSNSSPEMCAILKYSPQDDSLRNRFGVSYDELTLKAVSNENGFDGIASEFQGQGYYATLSEALRSLSEMTNTDILSRDGAYLTGPSFAAENTAYLLGQLPVVTDGERQSLASALTACEFGLLSGRDVNYRQREGGDFEYLADPLDICFIDDKEEVLTDENIICASLDPEEVINAITGQDWFCGLNMSNEPAFVRDFDFSWVNKMFGKEPAATIKAFQLAETYIQKRIEERSKEVHWLNEESPDADARSDAAADYLYELQQRSDAENEKEIPYEEKDALDLLADKVKDEMAAFENRLWEQGKVAVFDEVYRLAIMREIVEYIYHVTDDGEITQEEAAELLNIDNPVNYLYEGFVETHKD